MSMAKRLSKIALSAVFGVVLLAQSAQAQPEIVSVAVSFTGGDTALGIGGTVTATIEAKEFNISGTNPPMTALVWLVSDAADASTVLFDNTVAASVDNIVLGALGKTLGDLQASGKPLHAAKRGTGASGASPSFVAAHQQRTALGPSAVFGDAHTPTTKSTPDGSNVSFIVTLKIPPSAGTVSGVHVAVALFNSASSKYSQDKATGVTVIKVDPTSFSVDADRPSQADISLTGNVTLVYADGTTSGDHTKQVSGFTNAPTTRDVAGVGDQIRVDINLDLASDGTVTGVSKEVVGDKTLTMQVSAYGKTANVDVAKRTASVLNHLIPITEAGFANADIAASAGNTTITAFTVDAVGNQSSGGNAEQANDSFADDVTPTGVTASVSFVIDDHSPSLAGLVDPDDKTKGDRFTPSAGEAISDGSLVTGSSDDGYKIGGSGDLLSYRLPETMEALSIQFKGSSVTITLVNDKGAVDSDLADATLGKDLRRYLDFTALGTAAPAGFKADSIATTDTRKVVVTKATITTTGEGSFAANGEREGVLETGSVVAESFLASAFDGVDKIATGVYDLEVIATDVAGNKSTPLSVTGVTVDVSDIALTRRFPTKDSFGPTSESRRDTLNSETANVVFQLSEIADSVLISFTPVGEPADSAVTFDVEGSQRAITDKEQEFPTGAGLTKGVNYVLSIVTRDLAGNYAITPPDTFHFNSGFSPFVIAKFVINVIDDAGAVLPVGKDAAKHQLAGTVLTVKITATADDGSAANTFKENVTLTIAGGQSVEITGTGVTIEEVGTKWGLTKDEWLVGSQTLTLKNTTSIDSLKITAITKDADSGGQFFTGELDSTIVYNPEAYTAIILSTAADTVGQGDNFWVDVILADKFGNTRTLDSRFLAISASALGVQLPEGAMKVDGASGFWANVSGSSGWVTLTGRDIVPLIADAPVPGTAANTGDFLSGALAIYVDSDGERVLDAPDNVMAEDYMGAKGGGDQGGFIALTWDLSDDHSSLTGYRIFREVVVTYETDETGAIVDAAEGTMDLVPWGVVDAIPGVDLMRVIVATLDGDSTAYGVAAERGNLTTAKQAFTSSEGVGGQYELMAQTLQMSREVAQLNVEGFVQATLTPEALAFGAGGIAPRLKSIDGLVQSAITESNVIRAIDNIAPEPVAFIRALDTPGDAGGSVTVGWSKSPSDQLLSYTVGGSIGGNTFSTAGVKGYNILRKEGDGGLSLVGTAGPGETSFTDQFAFNGVRYTYQVQAFDNDNTAGTELSSTAMPIRNIVRDIDGVLVHGLFGSDNRVGIDDFFIFADAFGLGAGDRGFDPAYDLVPNNRIDLTDFFVFAENFGRSIGVVGKVVPLVAGLNGDARLYLDAGGELARVGEEFTVAVNLEEYVDLKGYGFSLSFDSQDLEFVGTRVGDDNILGESEFAQPRVLSQDNGVVTIAAFGEGASEGDLDLSLVFRSLREIEATFIEVTDGQLRDGNFGLNAIRTPVSVRIETRPEVYALRDNYPNPFNPETTIKYELPAAGDVRLEVYNMLGQVVTTLVDKQQAAGRYVFLWQGTNDNGNSVGSGIYFYRIQVGSEFQSVRKMLLLK